MSLPNSFASTGGGSMPDPFGFASQCSSAADTQLMTDTFANIVNSTFTFRCCNQALVPPSCIDQPGPTFQLCSADAFHGGSDGAFTLCIGGIFEQHACAGAGYQQISWVGATSPRCAQPLLDFMKVQPAGVQYACCDSTSCALGTGTDSYACSSSRTLKLCIGDSNGAECLDPGSSTICSGNYTSAAGVQNTPSGTDPGTTAITSQSVTTIPLSTAVTPSVLTSSSSQSGLSASDVATIVGSTIGGVTSIIAVGAAVYKLKKRKKEKMNQPTPSEVSVEP